MAQRVQIILEDDLDGTTADKTIRFGWGGSGYEIDLSDKHVGEFEKAMTRWVESARRTGGEKRQRVAASTSTRSTARGSAPSPDPAQIKAIRDWAKSAGMSISNRGRIPTSIVEAFEAAHAS